MLIKYLKEQWNFYILKVIILLLYNQFSAIIIIIYKLS